MGSRFNSSNESSKLLLKESQTNEGEKTVLVPPRGRMVAIMAACMFLHISAFGMIVALGVIYVEFIAYFEATRSEAALVQSLFSGFCLGGSVILTQPVTKYDSGFIIIGASIVAAVGFCASALAPNISTVILLIGGVAGLASSIHVLAAFVISSWTFKDHRKLAVAILIFGSTIGQIIMPYLTTALLDEYAWQGTVLILGGFWFLNCVPCGLLFHYSKQYFYKGDAQKLQKEKWISVKCLTDMAFMIFLTTCFANNVSTPVEQLFIVDMSVVKGYTTDEGATLLSILGIFGFVGRVIGLITLKVRPNTHPEVHLIYLFVIVAVAHVIVSQSQAYWGMMLGIIVRGISVGQVSSLFSALLVDIRGLESYPQTISISFFLFGSGSILGGFLGGLTFDLTGSYGLIFYIAAGIQIYISFAMLLIFVILRQKSSCHKYEQLK